MKSHRSLQKPIILPRHNMVNDAIRMGVIHIARHFEPYDDYVTAVDMSQPQDRLELMTVLEADGAFSREVFTMVEELGSRIHACLLRREERDLGHGVSPADHRRRVRRFDSAMEEIKKSLTDHGRGLAAMMVDDACRVSLTSSVAGILRAVGEERAFEDIRRNVATGLEKDCLGVTADCYLLAYMNRGLMSPREDPFKNENERRQALTMLKEVELEPRPQGEGLRFPSPLMGGGRPLMLEVFIPENLDPLIVACFRSWSHDHNFSIEWALSRVTGELLPAGSRFGSIRSAFLHYNRESLYQLLQDTCLAALLSEVMDGHLKERAFVVGRHDVHEEDAQLPTAPEPEGRLPAALEVVTEAVPAPATSIETSTVVPESTPKERRKRDSFREGRLTWRRIISALKRLGVTFEYGGRHPKLRYGPKSSAFLNPHSEDSRKNRWVLYNTLDVLGIDRQAFFDEL